MQKVAYLGIDIGSVSTKGAVIDEHNNIISSEYVWTQGDPLGAVKTLLRALSNGRASDFKILAVGTTGSARKLAGVMLRANAVKNEITAHAVGAMSKYPDVKTIVEIGGQDSKIILLENGIVIDYAMNTLCAAGTGAFLAAQARRMGLAMEEIGDIALKAKNPTKIAARCTVFAESDMVHKAQTGHKKEDLVAGLCEAVVSNYVSNVGKGKPIRPPVVFQGGVSKNSGVVKAFERLIGAEVYVDEHSHVMGAVGAAILAKRNPETHHPFDFAIAEASFDTKAYICTACPNNCEIICFYQENVLLDSWGGRCPKGQRCQNKVK